MPSDFGDRRAARPATAAAGGAAYPPPAQSEHLPCPRCDSTNTKFCYYNNYNLSQPRHFCKACRRYWTQGGTLRNIPVGGGTRKTSKRSRPSSSATSTTSSASSMTMNIISSSNSNPVSLPKSDIIPCDVNLNDTVSGPGSFTSLLGSQGSAGFLALGGYGMGGLGPSPAFEDMAPYGFGGRGIWAFPEPESGGAAGGGASAAASGWQVNGVENGLVDGECFAWPELAISMPGQGLK